MQHVLIRLASILNFNESKWIWFVFFFYFALIYKCKWIRECSFFLPSFHSSFLSGICSTLWAIFQICCHALTHSNFYCNIKILDMWKWSNAYRCILTLLGTQINFFSVRHTCCQASFHANFLSSNQICFFSVRLSWIKLKKSF